MNRLSSIRALFVLLVLLSGFGLSGCLTLGPDFEAPVVDVPAAYRFAPDDAGQDQDLKWWELFKDPVLYELVTTALENNQDLKTALSRIEEARFSFGMTRADRFPALNLGGGGFVGNYSGTRSTFTNKNLYISPTLSWELDFWGKFKRATTAAYAQILASAYGAWAVRTSLIADVVSAYYQLLDYRQRLEMSKETLTSRQDGLDIITKRFDKGIIPKIDVNQAQIQLEVAAGAIPSYERLIAKTEHRLKLLMGSLPGAVRTVVALDKEPLPPMIPVGMPASLLARRPEIKSALALVHAANEKIGVAVAQRFPAISLTGVLGLASSEVSDITNHGGIWNLSGSLLGPLFDFNKSKFRVEVAKEQTRQALFNYQEVVLTAFKEVEDALVEVDTYRRESDASQRKVAAAENAYKLSFERYDKGVSSYLEVLDSQRTLFSAQLEYSQNRQLYFNAYVNLYKALGGGWLSKRSDAVENTALPVQ
ncbi:efflux transporter outer membrane subunit [uncultured Desulfobacter sp.]|uniref:efflux transporter outer membrane subunit n=1 Tax=uncultured Desulfobacter sp. TaxID=240139 RepID=UPI002AA8AE51|nr:efflux transporter outer membrane subunit [uncultured Desulfobacter sp.]